jgi:hypothetical protein
MIVCAVINAVTDCIISQSGMNVEEAQVKVIGCDYTSMYVGCSKSYENNNAERNFVAKVGHTAYYLVFRFLINLLVMGGNK